MGKENKEHNGLEIFLTPESPMPKDTVGIGQMFQVFEERRTVVEFREDLEYPNEPRYMTMVDLILPNVESPLPVSFLAHGQYKTVDSVFTPFTPEIGYQVDLRDFNDNERVEKIDQLWTLKHLTDPPHTLQAFAFLDEMPDNLVMTSGISFSGNKIKRLRPEIAAQIDHTYLQIFFPTGARFEARRDPMLFEGSPMFSHNFYPFDTGPLASPIRGEWQAHEGLALAIPSAPDIIQSIRARFVLR